MVDTRRAVAIGWLLLISPALLHAEDDHLAPTLENITQLAASDQHASAVRLARRLLHDQPSAAEAYYLLGRSLFCEGDFAGSVQAFDRYVALRPQQASRQWERGIACYYAGRFEEGAKQFELYQTYHDNDVENSTWRFLCLVPLQGVAAARETMLPIRRDPRVPMMEIYDLYRGVGSVEQVWEAVERGEPPPAQRDARLFYARLYVGLYLEATGKKEEARPILLAADEAHRETAGVNHFMWWVAHVHAERLRGHGETLPGK